jgi:hypothetical protein
MRGSVLARSIMSVFSMPSKNGKPEVELKVRIPKALMDKINVYRFKNQMESKKEAVIALLNRALGLGEKS